VGKGKFLPSGRKSLRRVSTVFGVMLAFHEVSRAFNVCKSLWLERLAEMRDAEVVSYEKHEQY